MIALIDNYDSFTYNLAQYIGGLGFECVVHRNDEISVAELAELQPDALVISPGPGRPRDAGISNDAVRHFTGKIPILGVCLGHQCIAEVFGGSVGNADRLMHGKTSQIYHIGSGIFRGLPSPMEVGRYHSLIVEDGKLTPEINVTAHTAEGEIMALKIKNLPIEGVQFHPESILTRHGKQIMANFLNGGSR